MIFLPGRYRVAAKYWPATHSRSNATERSSSVYEGVEDEPVNKDLLLFSLATLIYNLSDPKLNGHVPYQDAFPDIWIKFWKLRSVFLDAPELRDILSPDVRLRHVYSTIITEDRRSVSEAFSDKYSEERAIAYRACLLLWVLCT